MDSLMFTKADIFRSLLYALRVAGEKAFPLEGFRTLRKHRKPMGAIFMLKCFHLFLSYVHILPIRKPWLDPFRQNGERWELANSEQCGVETVVGCYQIVPRKHPIWAKILVETQLSRLEEYQQKLPSPKDKNFSWHSSAGACAGSSPKSGRKSTISHRITFNSCWFNSSQHLEHISWQLLLHSTRFIALWRAKGPKAL